MRAMAVFLPSLEDDFLLMDNRQLSNKEKYPMINYWLELLTAFFKCKDLVSEKKNIYISSNVLPLRVIKMVILD